ncbi:MAG: hypothetical protein NTW68_09655 [candidate division NC10 bacterium]|nr:hypothetical protein [candidate division NC10 bacterium]
MSQKLSAPGKPPRIPPPVDGIQVNFCKNPGCPNYGVPALPRVAYTRLTADPFHDHYEMDWGKLPSVPLLHCQLCREEPPIKSNQAVAEERARLLAPLQQRPEPSCPNPLCANHPIPLSRAAGSYQSFGKTHSGSRRYRCKACRQTFSVGIATLRQKAPEKNRTIFTLLVNKAPLRRICEVAQIDPSHLYWKIKFLTAQCQTFVADRERRLLGGLPLRRLYLTTDRQEYMVNWPRQEDRRNVLLHAVGTADTTSGYVFGVHLNYDPTLDAARVEAEAEACGDLHAKRPFRRFARCWLAADYAESHQRQAVRGRRGRVPLPAAIQATYDEALEREDVEVSDPPSPDRRLPAKGMQLHAEYTLYGHFFYLRELFRGVEKLRFFLDQDSGMRAACLAAFHPEIAARRADAFYVRIASKLTISEKRAAIAESRRAFQEARRAHPDLSETEVKLLLIKTRMREMAALGKWQDKWLTHPFPHMSEPRKAVCYLTDYGDYDEDHRAWLYNKASLHAIDCFFMQVRRRLSILERPIASASALQRTWYGYSPYNPENILRLLTIFRAYYNYCLPGKGGTTPAMRLGLASAKVDLEDIIRFQTVAGQGLTSGFSTPLCNG